MIKYNRQLTRLGLLPVTGYEVVVVVVMEMEMEEVTMVVMVTVMAMVGKVVELAVMHRGQRVFKHI
jgi:hypothetical protein